MSLAYDMPSLDNSPTVLILPGIRLVYLEMLKKALTSIVAKMTLLEKKKKVLAVSLQSIQPLALKL
jgi:hypothetical protein